MCDRMQPHPPGVEEDAELKWGHLKFLALTPTPKNLHQNLQLHLILTNEDK